MNENFFSGTAIVTIIIFTGLLIMVSTSISFDVNPVYAQQQQQQQPPSVSDDQRLNGYGGGGDGPRYHVPYGGQAPFAQASNFSFGPIASIQNDESGQPAWVVVGNWRSNLLSFNETTTTTGNGIGDNNTSSPAGGAAVFNTNFRMIMLDGSGAHTHVITNFILSNVSSNENGTMTYTGNSTVSMPEGPLEGVPTTIKFSGEIMSIFPDPSAVNQHFGNTPIYGAVLPEEGPRRGSNYGPPPPPSSSP